MKEYLFELDDNVNIRRPCNHCLNIDKKKMSVKKVFISTRKNIFILDENRETRETGKRRPDFLRVL